MRTEDEFMEIKERERFEALHGSTQLPAQSNLTYKNLLDLGLSDITELAKARVQEVKDGYKDGMEVLIYAKKGAAYFKAVDDNVKNIVYGKNYISKGEEYGKHSVKVEQAELGVAYDYSGCNDPEYDSLRLDFDSAKKELEKRQTFLKAVTKDLEVVDTETGETRTIKPPVRTATLGYKISLR